MSELGRLCFVLMPFGKKRDTKRQIDIDFDHVYRSAIEPGIRDAGLEPVRGDLEQSDGIIQKAMFERLLLCPYAVADLTTGNANVFYELGIRHAARPSTTVALFAQHQAIPFDVGNLRALPYDLGEDNSFPEAEQERLRAALAQKLGALRKRAQSSVAVDSPLFDLLDGWAGGQVAHMRTDLFSQQVREKEDIRQQMQAALVREPAEALEALREIERGLGDLDLQETAVLVQLLLNYRAVSAWADIVRLYEDLPRVLQEKVMVREQLAMALNRQAEDKSRSDEEREIDRNRAAALLAGVVQDIGPNPETCGLQGRIHKALWREMKDKRPALARGHLENGIEAYRLGFESDMRDSYPGINLLTLLDLHGDDEYLAMRDELWPVVHFAAKRDLARGDPDYWAYATMLELAILKSDRKLAYTWLTKALAKRTEPWMGETTASNLGDLMEARGKRGEDLSWLEDIVAELRRAD